MSIDEIRSIRDANSHMHYRNAIESGVRMNVLIQGETGISELELISVPSQLTSGFESLVKEVLLAFDPSSEGLGRFVNSKRSPDIYKVSIETGFGQLIPDFETVSYVQPLNRNVDELIADFEEFVADSSNN
jgi:hypothetical protein